MQLVSGVLIIDEPAGELGNEVDGGFVVLDDSLNLIRVVRFLISKSWQFY